MFGAEEAQRSLILVSRVVLSSELGVVRASIRMLFFLALFTDELVFLLNLATT